MEFRLRSVGLLLTSVTITITAVLASPTAPAWAAKKPTFICTTLSGTEGPAPTGAGGITEGSVSGCSGDTGGSGAFVGYPDMTITWANSKTTSVSIPNPKVRFSRKQPPCSSGPTISEYRASGRVTADTTGSTAVRARVNILLCRDAVEPDIAYLSIPSGGRFTL